MLVAGTHEPSPVRWVPAMHEQTRAPELESQNSPTGHGVSHGSTGTQTRPSPTNPSLQTQRFLPPSDLHDACAGHPEPSSRHSEQPAFSPLRRPVPMSPFWHWQR
eukprot:Amastigsp_a843768_19.p6 type:complete len:105 gc:universal Amastigsp_a843768_19:548-234(-)